MPDFNLGVARGAIDINTASLAKAQAATSTFAKSTEASLAATSAKMASIGKNMTKFITVPLIGLAVLSVKAFNEQAKAEALVAQGIKTTGGAAHVTAQQAAELADSLQKTTTFADETTLSAESMLLTFTKVRNEVGEGNDIFNQGIKLAQDLSVRFGTDLTGAAKLVGKALNDPIKGLTAMTRVGVSFTEQQKAQIKTLVANGEQLKAQKIILGELAVEVGGTAEAFAQTAEGKMKIALNSINNQLEKLGAIIVPILAQFLTLVSTLVDGFVALPGPIKGVVGAFALLLGVTGPVLSASAKIVKNWDSIKNGATSLITFLPKMITKIALLGTAQGVLATTGTAAAAAEVELAAGETAAGVAGAAAAPGVAALSLATGVLLIALADLAGAAYLVKISLDINKFNKESEAAEIRTASLAFNLEGLQSGTLADMKAAWAEQSGALNDTADRMALVGVATKELRANYEAGKISIDTFRNGLLAMGFTQEQVNAILAQIPIPVYIDEMNAAGAATRKFAGLSVSEFKEWATSTKDSIRTAILSLGTLDIRADTTRKDMDKSFRLMLQNAIRFDKDMRILRNLNIGLSPRDEDKFKKFLIDSGPAAVDRFVSSSKKDQQKWGEEWAKATQHVDDTEQTIDKFSDTSSDNIDKTHETLIGFNDDWEWLRAHAVTNLTVNIKTNGKIPTDGRASGGVLPRGALTTVGEHGPELLFLPRGAGVLPSRQTLRLLSKFASATDRSRIPVSVGTPATGGVGGGMRGLRIEGTLDTPWGPSDIRGVVVEELREDHVFDSSRERTRR